MRMVKVDLPHYANHSIHLALCNIVDMCCKRALSDQPIATRLLQPKQYADSKTENVASTLVKHVLQLL